MFKYTNFYNIIHTHCHLLSLQMVFLIFLLCNVQLIKKTFNAKKKPPGVCRVDFDFCILMVFQCLLSRSLYDFGVFCVCVYVLLYICVSFLLLVLMSYFDLVCHLHLNCILIISLLKNKSSNALNLLHLFTFLNPTSSISK